MPIDFHPDDIITDETVGPLHVEELKGKLIEAGIDTLMIQIPAGEEFKTRETKLAIENELFALQCGKDTCIVALGGGVVLDLVGFVAATYLRGLPLIFLPTTLLAMVDAAVGGKNGVNTQFGKNTLGSFYAPLHIGIHPDFLRTLSDLEMKNGLAEVIKYGLILDSSLFEVIESSKSLWDERDQELLAALISRSMSLKNEIVQRESQTPGIRHILNFGHTVGHAIELVSNYEVKHGAAIAIGMVLESYYSLQLKLIDKAQFDRICALFKLYDFDLKLPEAASGEQLLEMMRFDKKNEKRLPAFVTLQGLGSANPAGGHYVKKLGPALIKDGIEWMHSEFTPAESKDR